MNNNNFETHGMRQWDREHFLCSQCEVLSDTKIISAAIAQIVEE